MENRYTYDAEVLYVYMGPPTLSLTPRLPPALSLLDVLPLPLSLTPRLSIIARRLLGHAVVAPLRQA